MVGTVDSGLNSVVLANNNEMVLLPLNEPTYGTNRKSQIQTYLEQNQVCCLLKLFCFFLMSLLYEISTDSLLYLILAFFVVMCTENRILNTV